VLRDLPAELRPQDAERLSAWLPKTLNGDVDWAAAEEWRTSATPVLR